MNDSGPLGPGALPMVPVSPSTVMIMMPPSVAGLGPVTTTVTLFAAAAIRPSSMLVENVCAPRLTAPDRVGSRSKVSIVYPWPATVPPPVREEQT